MNINSMGRGGGRGRGMNNIPAWLAKKQKELAGKSTFSYSLIRSTNKVIKEASLKKYQLLMLSWELA